jgi:hypothetical protein
MKRVLFLMLAVYFAFTMSGYAETHYVDCNNAMSASPYLTWETAATNIQDAVGVAVSNDAVLVTNGVYDAGGAITPGYSCMNRVVITNDITVQSVNGPEATYIVGAPDSETGGNGTNAVRGVYMSAGKLTGFTITNGYTGDGLYWTLLDKDEWCDSSGGGVNMYGGDGVVSNCVIVGNTAGMNGGGSCCGSLSGCTLCGNQAVFLGVGGGSCDSVLNNCVISNNQAFFGGGSSSGALTNCTLIANTAFGSGGGSDGSVLDGCTLVSNTVSGGGMSSGGGSSGGILIGCTITGSSARQGGGSFFGVLSNCTVCGNSADDSGGGVYGSSLRNCIVYGNSADGDGDNWYAPEPDFMYCCTAPDPEGTGCVTNVPQFIDAFGGDYHLKAISPCINAGNNADAAGEMDLDGNARIVGGVVDMGAYERQDAGIDADGDGMSDLWEMNHSIGRHFCQPGTISANGVDTLLEAYVAGLDPDDPDAVFLASIQEGSLVQWSPSISGRVYSVYWATNLLERFQPLKTNITWTVNSYTDTVYSAESSGFFKVGVELEP